MSHHVLFGGESGGLGASRSPARDLQARISKVPEAVYKVRERSVQEQSDHVLENGGCLLMFVILVPVRIECGGE